MNDIDLNIYPLAGQEPSALGLLIAQKPRRVARNRDADRLVLHMHLDGNAPMPPDKQAQLLERLAQVYYQTPGAVTGALKASADSFNQYLMERNARGSSGGYQAVGFFTQLVVRDHQVYLAQSGPSHVYLLTEKEVQDYYDPDLAGKGLGLNRSAQVRFCQFVINPDDSLIIIPHASALWTANQLAPLYGQGPEGIRRRLAGQGGIAAGTFLFQAKTGAGKTFLLQSKPTASPEPSEAGKSEAAHTLTRQGSSTSMDGSQQVKPPLVDQPGARALGGELSPEGEQLARISPLTEEVIELPASFETQLPHQVDRASPLMGLDAMEAVVQPEQPHTRPPSQIETFEQVTPPPAQRVVEPRQGFPPSYSSVGDQSAEKSSSSRFARKAGDFFERLGKASQTFFRRILPDDSIFNLPNSVMAFFAVAIPIVVVTFASVVYFRSGQSSQYQVYFDQAQRSIQEAQSQTEPSAQRAAWQSALAYLDQAEAFAISTDSQALRSQAQAGLDQIEGVERMNFLPALLGGLPTGTKITHMAATTSELYLLDSVSGSVLRAEVVTRGYELDPAYQCGPGRPGAGAIGPLIDFVLRNKGNQLTASVLALDAVGNGIECEVDKQPGPLTLTPPVTGMGEIKAFDLDLGNVYTLDPQKNAVWIYWKSNFGAEPELFFSNEVPPMTDVIDLAVYEGDLYLLHVDGHVTQCIYSQYGTSPTRCTDPLPFTDSRPGRENQTYVPDAPFSQIVTVPPPDPALYFLEPAAPAIYQFSLRLLAFHHQYRISGSPLGAIGKENPQATAFALSPDNRVLVAYGDVILYASLP